MDVYRQAELRYDYAALEPHVSAKLLELHYAKHHAAYVKGANEALDKLAAARDADDFSNIGMLEKNLAFNLSGHVLHSIFWECMSPDGGGEPAGDLAELIGSTFGSMERLRGQLDAAVSTLQGSGWAALAWEPLAGRLVVQQIYDHQSNVGQGSDPLLVIDGWEHAYYLDYLNDKSKWLKAFWQLVDWQAITRRYEAVSKIDWHRADAVQR